MTLPESTLVTPGALAALATREDVRRALGSTRFLGAAELGIAFSTPTLDAYQSAPVWTLADSVVRGIGGAWTPPADWRAFDAAVVWTNQGADAGSVVFRLDVKQMGVGDTLPPTVGTSVTAVAPAQSALAVSTLKSYVVRDLSKPYAALQLVRLGNDAADTLAASAGVLGVLFTRRA